MLTITVPPDSFDRSLYVVLRDTVTGTPTGNIPPYSLRLSFTRAGEAPTNAVALTPLASPNAPHTDYGAIEVDAINSPGLYRVDVPDAAFASPAPFVVVCVRDILSYIDPVYVLCRIDRAVSELTGIVGTFLAEHRYDAVIDYREDAVKTCDDYTVVWHRDGVPLERAAISSPTIRVVRCDTGDNLIATAAMGWDDSDNVLRYSGVGSQRNASQSVLLVIASAVIDGAVRSARWVASRDV